MSKLLKMLMLSITAAGIAAPIAVNASELRSVSCSVTINYLVNDVLRAPYQKDFILTPGAVFTDDFSTVTRFRFFDAATHLDDGDTVVTISYFNDVGVFEFVDFRTRLKIRDDGKVETNSGTHTYFTSLGTAGEHTTDYTLACARLKR
jgi:hypothetical protein